MIASITQLELDGFLERPEIEMLCKRPGPWISMLLPGYQPGTDTLPHAQQLKHLLPAAHELWTRHKLAPAAETILEPIEGLARQSIAESGGGGWALFRAPGHFSLFRLSAPVEQRLAVGRYPLLRPFLAAAAAPLDFFILELSRKHLRLLRYRRGTCAEVPLPAGIPHTLLEAGAFDPPDHTLVNRSAAGSSQGAMRGVRFGTGSDYESKAEYLAHYFLRIDGGLRKELKNAPLLLAGVTEEVAAFRRVARYPNLLDAALPADGGLLNLAKLALDVQAAARDHTRRQAQSALLDYQETLLRHKTLHNSNQILSAAAAGRVHCIIAAEDLVIEAAPKVRSRPHLLPGEDLINAAAVETIRHAGEVYLLPSAEMGEAAPLAAILRY
jgi:hypothetical protein